MRSFRQLYDRAADRHGGPDALEALLPIVRGPEELAAVPDDRWLSMMTRFVFSAGFNWKVIENKWDGFEVAFDGFDLGRCAMLNDEDIDRLLSDTRIVRHGAKIRSVRENAAFCLDLAREHGSVGAALGGWPSTDFAGLLDMLKRRGSRLGGASAQYFLRFMRRDSYILSRDVAAALIEETVVDKTPSSKRDMAAVQAAFNRWMAESGRGLSVISRVLALGTGPVSDGGHPT